MTGAELIARYRRLTNEMRERLFADADTRALDAEIHAAADLARETGDTSGST